MTTPDLDTGFAVSPDLTARMKALVQYMAGGADAICAKWSPKTTGLGHAYAEARAIADLMAPPVDPDLIEARKLAAVWSQSQDVSHSHYLDGHMDDSAEVRGMVAAIKRGREIGCKSVEDSTRLALAGGTEA